MNIQELSNKYSVRELSEEDVDIVYEIALGNPLFYEHCPPKAKKENILSDMKALPPNCTYKQKYYLGFFQDSKLIAVMDLILDFPNSETAFIGFFMLDKSYQGRGKGTELIEEASGYLKTLGYSHIRLGYAKGNPQSRAFWLKNNFIAIGVESEQEGYTVVLMDREL